ncbi:MAG: hypothetical protein AAB089_02485, partial [Nitrospirota bacterium]
YPLSGLSRKIFLKLDIPCSFATGLPFFCHSALACPRPRSGDAESSSFFPLDSPVNPEEENDKVAR